MVFGALGFQLTQPTTPAKTGGFSIGSVAGGAAGIASDFITKLITPNYNKPEYQPSYYINASKLYPNGVPTTQTAIDATTAAATAPGVSNDLLLYGGLGLAGVLAIIFLTKKK